MKNKIIIDGLWGTGKTSTMGIFKQKSNYIVVSEPDHLNSRDQVENVDINDWYIKQHEKNQKIFFTSDSNIIMERSIISSMAYFYATKETKNIKFALRVFAQFKKWYLNNKVIFVFLYADKDKIENIANKIQNTEIKSKLMNSNFNKNYEQFYRVILPFKYNVYPLFINIFNKIGKRRSTDEVVDLIQKQLVSGDQKSHPIN